MHRNNHGAHLWNTFAATRLHSTNEKHIHTSLKARERGRTSCFFCYTSVSNWQIKNVLKIKCKKKLTTNVDLDMDI